MLFRSEEQYKNEPWPHIEIQDACEFIVDCVNKTAPVVDHKTPYRMIRTTNVREGRINLEECRYVTEDTYLRWTRRATVEDGDVLLTREAPIGEVGYAEGLGKVFLGQRIMQYRSRPSILQPRFLFYSFQSHTLTSQFSAHEGSGSVVSHIRVGDCFKFRVPLPPLPIQQRIASILGTLDDKIALNRRINQTLEAMAQALFQSWFVDFDPVKAKQKILGAGGTAREAELAAMQIISGKNPHQLKTFQQTQPQQYAELEHTAKLFPNRLVESELGPVPEGWEVSSIGKEVQVLGGGTPSTGNPEFWENGTIHWTTPKDLSNQADKILLSTDRKITEQGLASITSQLMPIDTLLMSSRAPVGYLAMAKIPVAVNQGYIAMRCEKTLTPEFVIQWCSSVMDEIKQRASGTTFAEISKKVFGVIQVLLPNEQIIQAYSVSVKSIYASITNNAIQVQKLTETRDTLLPKLLSGEIDASSLECL